MAPFAHATAAGPTLYVTGQMPTDPRGVLVGDDPALRPVAPDAQHVTLAFLGERFTSAAAAAVAERDLPVAPAIDLPSVGSRPMADPDPTFTDPAEGRPRPGSRIVKDRRVGSMVT